MGEKLVKYYDVIGKKGGLQAQMRLAMKTNLPVTKAKDVPDSADMLNKFYEVAKEIVGPDAPRPE